jgi:hypothetical protein
MGAMIMRGKVDKDRPHRQVFTLLSIMLILISPQLVSESESDEMTKEPMSHGSDIRMPQHERKMAAHIADGAFCA